MSGKTEDTQRAGDGQSFAPRGEYSFPIVHQNQIGVMFDGKRDSILFARVKVLQRNIPLEILGCAHLHPGRGIGNPVSNQKRSIP